MQEMPPETEIGAQYYAVILLIRRTAVSKCMRRSCFHRDGKTLRIDIGAFKNELRYFTVVCARIHQNCTADASGDSRGEFQSAEASLTSRIGQTAQQRSCSCV